MNKRWMEFNEKQFFLAVGKHFWNQWEYPRQDPPLFDIYWYHKDGYLYQPVEMPLPDTIRHDKGTAMLGACVNAFFTEEDAEKALDYYVEEFKKKGWKLIPTSEMELVPA